MTHREVREKLFKVKEKKENGKKGVQKFYKLNSEMLVCSPKNPPPVTTYYYCLPKERDKGKKQSTRK